MNETDSILSMTEHGVYVWTSYGIVAVVLIGLAVFSLKALRTTGEELRRAEDAAKEQRTHET